MSLDLSQPGFVGRENDMGSAPSAPGVHSTEKSSSSNSTSGLMGYDHVDVREASKCAEPQHILDIDVSRLDHSMPEPSSLPQLTLSAVPRFVAHQLRNYPLESATIIVALYFLVRTLPNELHILRSGVCPSVTDDWTRNLGWLLAAVAVCAVLGIVFVLGIRFMMYRVALKFQIIRTLNLALMVRMEVGMRGVQVCLLGAVAFVASVTAIYWPLSATRSAVCIPAAAEASGCSDCSHASLWIVALPLCTLLLNSQLFLNDSRENSSILKLWEEQKSKKSSCGS